MQFINPYDFIDDSVNDPASIEKSTIKKTKKRVLADIELEEDQTIIYKGKKITKNDVLKAFDLLEDSNKREFLIHLHNDQKLNEFLANGNTSFFNNYRQESIYKLPEFVEFITPYFAENYSKILKKCIKDKDHNKLKNILKHPFSFENQHEEKLYKEAHLLLKNNANDIDEITQKVKKENGSYTENEITNIAEKLSKKEV